MYFNIVQTLAKGDEASPSIILAGRTPLVKNAHNSWTAWYILFKFCILMYFNIAKSLVCKTVTRLHRASFWPVEPFVNGNAHNS